MKMRKPSIDRLLLFGEAAVLLGLGLLIVLAAGLRLGPPSHAASQGDAGIPLSRAPPICTG